MTKITNQKSGSTFDGITKTVAMPIASPNKESSPINFHFMVSPLKFLPRRTCFYSLNITSNAQRSYHSYRSARELSLLPPGGTAFRQDVALRGTTRVVVEGCKGAPRTPRGSSFAFCPRRIP